MAARSCVLKIHSDPYAYPESRRDWILPDASPDNLHCCYTRATSVNQDHSGPLSLRSSSSRKPSIPTPAHPPGRHGRFLDESTLKTNSISHACDAFGSVPGAASAGNGRV